MFLKFRAEDDTSDCFVWFDFLDKCVLLKDHKAVTPVRLEPAASQSPVKHSTSEPLRSHTSDRLLIYNLMKMSQTKHVKSYLTCLAMMPVLGRQVCLQILYWTRHNQIYWVSHGEFQPPVNSQLIEKHTRVLFLFMKRLKTFSKLLP